jgi:hypothetical protein
VTLVDPTVVVMALADTGHEYRRWRHVTRDVRARPDLSSPEPTIGGCRRARREYRALKRVLRHRFSPAGLHAAEPRHTGRNMFLNRESKVRIHSGALSAGHGCPGRAQAVRPGAAGRRRLLHQLVPRMLRGGRRLLGNSAHVTRRVSPNLL